MIVLLIIVVILFLGGIARGNKVGFIKEAAGAVRLLFAVVLLICIAKAVRSYMDHDYAGSISAGISIAVVSVAYKVVSYIVSFVELLGKLPLIKDLNRFAGGVLGGLEALVLVWALLKLIPMLGIPELTAIIPVL